MYQEATKDAQIEHSIVKNLPADAQPHMAIIANLADIVAIDRKNNNLQAVSPLVGIAEEQVDEMLPSITNSLEHEVLQSVLLPWLENLGREFKSGKATWTTLSQYYGMKNGVLEALLNTLKEAAPTGPTTGPIKPRIGTIVKPTAE